MNRKIVKSIIILLWVFFIGALTFIPTLFYLVRIDFNNWFGGLPSLQQLEKPDPQVSSILLGSDGVTLGTYHLHNRIPITYEELSPQIINTLLVTEDIRFKEHSGIDMKSLIRAIVGQLTFSFNGGGSTITMQLAENLYRTSSENRGKLYEIDALGPFITKLKEWIISCQLEKSYTKEEILAMYLNTIEYGGNAFGIKVASKTYFNKLPSQLNYNESAILVGIINAPTRWNPVINPENAKRKRTEILFNLFQNELISRREFDSLKVSVFGLQYHVESHNNGLAPYFRKVIESELADWANENGYNLYEDGLRIYTTIDSRLQKFAQEAMTEHMRILQKAFNNSWQNKNPWRDSKGFELEGFIENDIRTTRHYKVLVDKYGDKSDSIDYYLNKKRPMTIFSWEGEIDTLFSSYDSLKYYKKFLQTGFMAMNPKTGHIKAWVGGIDHKYFKYDHVRQSKRQPGSTFKPFVYTVAIDNGWSPCHPLVDVPIAIPLPGQDPPVWKPQNSNGEFTNEVMTIRQAMARSVNSITAHIMHDVGPENVVDYAHRLGIESPLTAVPSLALGTSEVSLFEMLGAYSTFINNGVYNKPFYISHIEDKYGNLIQKFINKSQVVLNEETAYIMLHMLKGTIEEPGGTGNIIDPSLRANNEIAAKTGTTQNASDGWFIGMTKDLAAGAWVGGDHPSIRFKNWALGQGARTAMPIWEIFMTKVYHAGLGFEKGSFGQPIKPISVELNCDKHNTEVNSIEGFQ